MSSPEKPTSRDVRRWLTPLVLACALHGATWAIVASRSIPRPAQEPPPVEPSAVDVTLDEAPVAPAPARPAEPPAALPAPGALGRSAHPAPGPLASSPSPRGSAGGAPEHPGADDGPTASRDFHFEALRPGVGLVDPTVAAKAAGADAEPPRPDEGADPGNLKASLAAADRSAGITRGGFVASAIESVVREQGPGMGKAQFDVRILRDGTLSIALTNASQDRAAFERLTSAIGKRIPKASLHLPDSAKGLRVLVDVDVHDQYADGTRPSDVGKVSAYAGPGEYATTKDGLIIKKMPGVSVTVRGKVCSGGFYVHPLGVGLAGGCSPENIGAPARKMVSAKVSREALL